MSNSQLVFLLTLIGLAVLVEWLLAESFGGAICGTMGLGLGLIFHLLEPESDGE